MFRCIGAVNNESSRLRVLSAIVFLSLFDMSRTIGVQFLIYSHSNSVPLSLESFPFVLVWIFSSFLFLPFIACFVLSIFVIFSSLFDDVFISQVTALPHFLS